MYEKFEVCSQLIVQVQPDQEEEDGGGGGGREGISPRAWTFPQYRGLLLIWISGSPMGENYYLLSALDA